jgi:hypothetical protein
MSIQKKSLSSGPKASKKAKVATKARTSKGQKLTSMKMPAHVVSNKTISTKSASTPSPSEQITFQYGGIQVSYKP